MYKSKIMKLINIDFNNKSIALIGNGTCTSLNGDIIDSYDIVVRFNGGIIHDNVKKHADYVGSKTSVGVWNWWTLDGERDLLDNEQKEITKTLEMEKIPVMFSARKYETKTLEKIKDIPMDIYKRMNDFDVISIGKIPDTIYIDIEKKFSYLQPTSGLSFIFYLLKYYNPSKITLFNWGLDGKHYYNNKFYDIMIDKRQWGLVHNGLNEYAIIYQLMKSYSNLTYN